MQRQGQRLQRPRRRVDRLPPSVGTTFHGWHDPVAVITVGADPYVTDPVLTSHQVWVYAYEASRPDATGSNPGSSSGTRVRQRRHAAVGERDAQAGAVGLRGDQGLDGRARPRLHRVGVASRRATATSTPATHWSMSSSSSTYVAEGVQRLGADGSALQRRRARCHVRRRATRRTSAPAATDADCPGATVGSCVAGIVQQRCGVHEPVLEVVQRQRPVRVQRRHRLQRRLHLQRRRLHRLGRVADGLASAAPAPPISATPIIGASGKAHDMTGNLQEWTSTVVTSSRAPARR